MIIIILIYYTHLMTSCHCNISIFHAVYSSMLISMGMLNPDESFISNKMALEMRGAVANILSSPEGVLYVNNKPKKRIVRCKDLLKSAANNEGLSTKEYLRRLRKSGKEGGLYGGGPELTVLSNMLRRPLSIYHLKQTSNIDTTEEKTSQKSREIVRMGCFGEGLFEDPCQSIPDSIVSNAVFFSLDSRSSSPSSPMRPSWHLHILIADVSENERHASLLLPSIPILHNNR